MKWVRFLRWARWLVWSAIMVAAAGAYAAHKLRPRNEQHATEGELGHVPAFSLTDQRGQTVTDTDLSGRPWVASFVFTRCATVCPTLTAKFAALQKKLSDTPLQFVSISVDPDYDTPEVLAAYAEKFGADPARWRFLTGDLQAIERTVVDGFKIHIGEAQPSPSDPTLVEIMHGEHFVLVDAAGVIRGYYQSDAAGLAELERAALSLSSD